MAGKYKEQVGKALLNGDLKGAVDGVKAAIVEVHERKKIVREDMPDGFKMEMWRALSKGNLSRAAYVYKEAVKESAARLQYVKENPKALFSMSEAKKYLDAELVDTKEISKPSEVSQHYQSEPYRGR